MQIKGMPIPAETPPADGRSERGARAGQGGDDPAAARKVAQEFEAMFVAMMLKSMRETVGKDRLTGGGRGEETFRSLLDQEYAQAATRGGGIGLAKFIEAELTRGAAAPAAPRGRDDAD